MKNLSVFQPGDNNSRISKNVIVLAVIFGILFSLNFSSCKKTGPAEALILVRDSTGRAISGATVILRQDTVVNGNTGVRADIYQEKVSDLEGNAFFSFQWEAVLNVEVKKGTLSETDYIRLEQSKTVEKPVILK